MKIKSTFSCVLLMGAVLHSNLFADPVTNWHTFRAAAPTTLYNQGTSSPVFGDTTNTASAAFLIGYLDTPLSLANVGDKITFTFDVSFNDGIGMSPSGADNFRFALYDLNGAAQAVDDNTATAGTSDTALYRGYWLGVKAGSGAAGSMRKRSGTTADQNTFANASATLLGTATGSSIVFAGTINDAGDVVIYSGLMSLELQTNGVALSGTFYGNGTTNTFSYVDTNSPFTGNFSAVGFLNGNALSADQFLFQNIDVSLTHPSQGVLLTITESGSDITVSWPSSAIGLNLQSTPSLQVPVTWTNVPDSAATNSMTFPLGSGATYFRLSN